MSKKIWDWKKERLDKLLKTDNREELRVKRDSTQKITIQRRFYKSKTTKPLTYWNHPDYSPQAYGNKLLQQILNTENRIFDFPKSVNAVYDCLDIFLPADGIVLDYFAGSGTTGHAVMLLNKNDGGCRRFVLCTNNENNICADVCYPRLKKIINGYKNSRGVKIEGLGGNLKYFKTDFVPKANVDEKMVKEMME